MGKVNKQDLFENIPVSKAIAKLAIPTILAMLVTVIYSLADTFFVGKVGDPNQVAAVTIASPMFVILMSIGSFFGVGSSSYISRMLGIKNYNTIKNTSSFCFYTSIVIGLVVIGIGLPLIDKIIKTMGTSENTFTFTRDYIKIIIIGSPFVITSFSLSQMLRAEGSAKQSMNGMILGNFLNIILDPIFILSFKMGVKGAAIATVFSNVISTTYFIIYISRKSEFLSLSFKHFKFDSIIIKNLVSVGIPALLTNILMSFSSIVLNNYAADFGDFEVAAIGIVRRVTMLPIFLLIGLCQGVQPLIGYNYSSKNYKRMRETMRITGIIATIISIVLTILLYFLNEFSIQSFIDNKEIIALGAHFLRIYLISIPFLGLLFLLNNTFQAFGKGLPALILSISRQGFIFIPIVILGANYFGIDGIVYAQPISDIFSVVMSIIMAIVIFKKEKLYIKDSTT